MRHLALLVVAVFLATSLFASPIIFTGQDPGVGAGGARPNSDAAAAAFAASVGSFGLINFEGLAVGAFAGALTIAPGVTVDMIGNATDTCAGICNVNDTILGYNTTSGGSNHLRLVPNFSGPNVDMVFSFGTPIDAWGAYLTGTGTIGAGTFTITFFDGSTQVLSVPETSGGGVEFYGFHDPGRSITQVTFTEVGPFVDGRDIMGLDDIRYSSANPVPEPSTMILLGSGLLAACARRKKA